MLSAQNRMQLFVPEGFAHGFCVVSETALVHYKCGDFYSPEAAVTIAWDDPELRIPWPIREPKLSAADRSARPLAAMDPARLPVWQWED
jgi:dTDP-4-dehydrorhamnose 3,5-epimerase